MSLLIESDKTKKEGLFTLRLLTSQLMRVTLKNKEKKVTRETEHFQEKVKVFDLLNILLGMMKR
jgi:hypothetical protein